MPGGEICTLSNELAQTGVHKCFEGVETLASGSTSSIGFENKDGLSLKHPALRAR